MSRSSFGRPPQPALGAQSPGALGVIRPAMQQVRGQMGGAPTLGMGTPKPAMGPVRQVPITRGPGTY